MRKRKHLMGFSTRIYTMVFLLFLFTVLVTGAICFHFALSIKNEDRDTTICDVSSMLAEMPQIVEMVSRDEPDPVVTEYLNGLQQALSQIDVIVICDRSSVRLYHTNADQVGKTFIGGDEGPILTEGTPYISIATGTLGLQRRAFHAVRDESGAIIGFVMVSVLDSHISNVRAQIIETFLSILLVMGLIGILLAWIGYKQLRSVLLGYRPEEFADLYIEREDVLNSLEEGLFAIDKDGKVILMNLSARRMLDLAPDEKTEGHLLTEYYPQTQLPSTVRTGRTEHNINFMVNGNHIISSRIPILRKGEIIGAVSIFRNRTEVTQLAEQLTGTRYMVDTLRAANHEFMNKLHVILGLLEMNEIDQAKDYIQSTSLVSGKAINELHERIPIASLAALLIGKMLRANELGISLLLKKDSYFCEKEDGLPVDAYVTLVGNLIENAMDELNRPDLAVKQIELGIYADVSHTTILCDDTGRGIPDDVLQNIYDPHTTTKGEGHGNGFYLMKEIVDRYGGDFHIDTELGEGTSIEIDLPV